MGQVYRGIEHVARGLNGETMGKTIPMPKTLKINKPGLEVSPKWGKWGKWGRFSIADFPGVFPLEPFLT
jgi:hypothetical protein